MMIGGCRSCGCGSGVGNAFYSGTISVDLFVGAMTCAADGGMICESLDLSYLGVQSLWRYDLGKIAVILRKSTQLY